MLCRSRCLDEEPFGLKWWWDWIRHGVIRTSELGRSRAVTIGCAAAVQLRRAISRTVGEALQEHAVCAEVNEMTVFVLIREDQNEHGYIDTSITSVFREARIAKEMETLERLHARQEGLVVEDDESPDRVWQVSWKVEEHIMG
jgi:ribosomal protein S12 methylthiotransferase accessory factor YcaO